MGTMKILGITGGVGAGKSTVLQYMNEKYQVRVIELDKAAHLLMEPGQSCYAPLTETFGMGILNAEGRIDRQRLYAETFAKQSGIETLNRIVHPRVKAYVRQEIAKEEKSGRPFLVLEAALLLEDHYDKICDEIWYVFVHEEARRCRLVASRGYSEEKIAQILKNQKTDEQFRASCQFVIDNSSNIMENTYEQIDKGLKEHGFV